MNLRTLFDKRKIGFGFVLWLLISFYFGANFAPWHLAAEVTTDATDVAQLYYSSNGTWSETESQTLPMVAGSNAITFTLPQIWPGKTVRFDPGQRTITYRIARLHWIHGGMSFNVPLDRISNPRSSDCHLSNAGGALFIGCTDNDSQLIVPAPDPDWILASFVSLLALPMLGLIPLLWLSGKIEPARMAGLFVAICASCYVFITLHHGPILPLYDDWRYVYPGPFDMVDGNWQWLTVVGNDTYFLTNQLIDFAVLKLTNVDFYWLRVVALTLLLIQLALQYRILTRAAGTSSIVGAIAITLEWWSLASDGYWGNTAVAYQQFLPTFFGTCALALLLRNEVSLRRSSICALLVFFCVASGLSYISGGLLMLSLGIACVLFVPRQSRASAGGAYRAGWLLGLLGTALLLLQIVLVNHYQGSLLQHNHAVASVYPTDRRFWLFFIALFGRALGYTGTFAPIDACLTVLFVFPAALFTLQRFSSKRATNESAVPSWWKLLSVYAGIGGISYALAVSFGRSGFAPIDATTAAVIALGKARFHYWPIAAMLPYVWLGWAEIARHNANRRAILGFAAIALLVPKSIIAFAHDSYVSNAKDHSLSGAACVVNHLSDAAAHRPVVCTALTSAPLNLGPVIDRLRARHSPLYSELIRAGGGNDKTTGINVAFHPLSTVATAAPAVQIYSGSIPEKIGNAQCALDGINGQPSAQVKQVSSGSTVNFSGWAGNGHGGLPIQPRLVLRGAHASYSAPFAVDFARPDVAKALNSDGMKQSGFNLTIQLDGVAPGNYTLYTIDSTDPAATCDLHREFAVQ